MKKYITCMLLCLIIAQILFAQGNSYSDIDRISKPFNYFKSGSFYGKNFFFENKWVKAKLLMADNTVIKIDSFLYNYDKIEQRLLLTTDFRRFFEIDKRDFKAILFYASDTTYMFKHINSINEKDIFQLIVTESGKYSLYKIIRTKLMKGDFGASPYLKASKQYDTYIDATEYFIFFPNRDYRSVFLPGKGSIERAFKLTRMSEQVSTFLNADGEKSYTEADLVKLVRFLNSQTQSDLSAD